MHDVMIESMIDAEIRGAKKAYELSEENYIRQKYFEEQQWLKDNGYLPK